MSKIEMPELQKLASALELLRKKHIQGELACDENGDGCDPTDPRAVSFCAMGAFQQVGVAEETIVAFAKHLVQNSSIAHESGYSLDNFDENTPLDEIEDVIFDVNDHEPRGRGAIRKALVRFVHEQLKVEEK